LLRPLFDGRRVILAGGVVAAWTPTVSLVRQLGATDVLVIGTEGRGAGPIPEPPDAITVALSAAPAESMLAGIHAGIALLHDPPVEVLAALREFDPRREALAVGNFLTTAAELDGRPFLAYRWPAWVALEDKTTNDALWDRLGVARAPAQIVSAERDALLDAAERVSGATGSVWAGDAREGFNGGAEYVRWVRTEADADDAAQFFAAHCDRVRVMPFLDGVPCSIHGIVFPDHVVALRPVEMVTLRSARGFFYAGCASFYDPLPATRAYMRDIAVTVGAALRADVGFRGAFTVDGVVTRDGFLPTELNPRMGAGIVVLQRGMPDLPVQLLLDALVAGIDLGYDAAELEADLLTTADAHRAGGTWSALPGASAEQQSDTPLAFRHDAWAWVKDTEVPAGNLTVGPAAVGAFVRCAFDPTQTPAGPSVGQRAAAFWAFADRELGTSVGPLSAAR
jgi:hypothetical protein